MCGICGKCGPDGVTQHQLEQMLAMMTHRGPDDQGTFVKGPIGLASNRLSIIDLEGGRMPIANEDGSVWVVLNGEIYNYKELRKELIGLGHTFKTSTDTEVIVHLYEEMGERCVERLAGMFAFAVWDDIRGRLMLARDRIGQKPLFYSESGASLTFASEIKALLAIRSEAPEMNEDSLHHFLSLRFLPAPETMLKGIRKLPPAHILLFANGRCEVSRYWKLTFETKREMDGGEWLEGLREKLQAAVTSHLVSDVPVGAYLSGGLDSSMVVAMIQQNPDANLKTFAVGVEEDDFDELPFARIVADHCKTDHVDKRVRANVMQLLPTIVWHMDEPSDPIAACQYHAADVASKHVKVVLGGDGGDELFAGFDRYYGIGQIDRYRKIPSFVRSAFRPLLHRMPDDFSYKNLAQKMRWVDQLSQVSDLADRYAEATFFFRFNHQEKQALLGSDVWNRLDALDSAAIIAEPYRSASAENALDRMLYADFVTRLPEHSLMLTDRMSMAHSLELRSPFLDHHLVEYMASCPPDLKMRDGELKVILRDLAKDFLPPAIVSRPKHGFMLPIAYWFRGPLSGFLRDFLLNAELVRNGTFRTQYVERLIDEHLRGKRDNHVRLWMLTNLEIWHSMYLRGQTRHEVAEDIQRRLNTTAV